MSNDDQAPPDFQKLGDKIERELSRMKRAKTDGKFAANAELIGTVMPLLLSLVRTVDGYVEAQEEWADAVDEQLEDLDDGGEHPLSEDDHALFSALTEALKLQLQMLRNQTLTEKLREALAQADALVEKAAERLEALKPEEEDDEDEEGDEDSDEADD